MYTLTLPLMRALVPIKLHLQHQAAHLRAAVSQLDFSLVFFFLFIEFIGVTDKQNYTGLRCSIPQHITSTLCCVFTTSRLLLSPLNPPNPPSPPPTKLLFLNVEPRSHSSVSWLIHWGCGFDPWSGQIQDSTNECINGSKKK